MHHVHALGWIPGVPKIPYEDKCKGRIRWLNAEEAKRLLQELPLHLRQFARFSLATGLRQSNVTYLRWDQVSIEHRRAWIHADESKNATPIAVPLSDDAIEILEEQIGLHPEFVFVYTNNQGKSAPVAKACTNAWKKACERAGLDDLRPHDLRHTWATWHVMNRTSLEVLQKLGGWKALAMVQRYAHLADQFTAQYAGNAKPVAFGQLTQNWHKAKAAADDKTGKNPLVNVLRHSLLVIPDTSFTVFGIDRENCYAMEGVSQDG